MDDNIIMIFKRGDTDKGVDIEVPAGITAGELIYGLNQGFHLGINMDNPADTYLRAENPVRLVRGEKTLAELGLHHGTTLYYERFINTDAE